MHRLQISVWIGVAIQAIVYAVIMLFVLAGLALVIPEL
jgi:hypothetical protein